MIFWRVKATVLFCRQATVNLWWFNLPTTYARFSWFPTQVSGFGHRLTVFRTVRKSLEIILSFTETTWDTGGKSVEGETAQLFEEVETCGGLTETLNRGCYQTRSVVDTAKQKRRFGKADQSRVKGSSLRRLLRFLLHHIS